MKKTKLIQYILTRYYIINSEEKLFQKYFDSLDNIKQEEFISDMS